MKTFADEIIVDAPYQHKLIINSKTVNPHDAYQELCSDFDSFYNVVKSVDGTKITLSRALVECSACATNFPLPELKYISEDDPVNENEKIQINHISNYFFDWLLQYSCFEVDNSDQKLQLVSYCKDTKYPCEKCGHSAVIRQNGCSVIRFSIIVSTEKIIITQRVNHIEGFGILTKLPGQLLETTKQSHYIWH